MLLIPILAFLFASLLVAAAAFAFAPAHGAAIEQRLGEVTGTRPRSSESDGAYGRRSSTLKRIATLHRSRLEMGKLQQKLGTPVPEPEASSSSSASAWVWRVVLLRHGDGDLCPSQSVLRTGGCGLGYLLTAGARSRGEARQHRIRLGLPDVLDLLVVTRRSGSGARQAIQRVGEELAFDAPRPRTN